MVKAILILFFSQVTLASQPLISVGVLEELRDRDANARVFVGTNNYKTHLRVMFKKPIMGWTAYPRSQDLPAAPDPFPHRAVWSACYQGNRVLSFEAINAPAIKYFSLIGSAIIPPQVLMPKTDAGGNKFAGWREEKATVRPLVATTSGRCDDLDYWRADEIHDLKKDPLIAELKGALAKTTWIEFPENENGNRTRKKNYTFKESEVALGDIFSSRRTKAKVAILKIKDDQKQPHEETFFISPAGNVSYIGASLYFLDAGDYDNSATSTLILRMQSQMRDGYVLVDSTGKRRADFYWGYE